MKYLKVTAILLCGLRVAVLTLHAGLTDYGSITPVAKPPQDKINADQKLDFHTDKFTGRFAYSIPIEAPPARAGSQPAVALEYNSANKNGWCGVGWDLDMGYIQRDTRHGVSLSFSGGRSGTPTYTNSMGFLFSFEGKSGRLIGITTNDLRPQIDSDFLKFNFSNGWWIVTDKSGRKYNFGETTGSQITNSFGAFRWALSSIVDANGNRTSLIYTNRGAGILLKEIDYNGNTNTPTISTNCAIVFDLTNRSDTLSSYISGSEIITSNLLGSVRVFSQGQFVRRYQLQYTNSPSTGRSLISKVTEYGSDNASTLPPHTFAYSVQNPSFQSATAWPITPETGAGIQMPYGTTLANQAQQLIDIDGDGLPDWVTIADSTPYSYFNVQLNYGSGFSSRTTWSPLSNEGSDGQVIWNCVDSSVASSSSGNVWTLCTLLDINGDLLPDRVMRTYSSVPSSWNHFQIQTNTGSGFASVQSVSGVSSVAGTDYQTPGTMSSDGEASFALLLDVNGDGLADRVMMSSSSEIDVQLNLGSSFDSIIAWTSATSDGNGSYQYSPRDRASPVNNVSGVKAELIDMNGDGLPDRVLNGGVQLNNGVTGFGSKITTWGYSGDPSTIDVNNSMYTTQLIDMNGDGLPDLVVSNGNGTYTVYFNTGRGFQSTGVTWSGVNTASDGTTGWNGLQAWDGNGTKVMFLDMDGDGLVDRVERDYSNGNNILVQLSTGPFPDLLIAANNGIGGSVAVAYTNSTTFNNYDGNRQRLPVVMYAVTSVTTGDGRGNSATTSYDYSAGLYDTTYREFRGFGVVTETDPLNAYTITWFHQGGGTNASALGEFNDDLAKSGMAFRIEQYGSDSKLYSRTLNKVDEVKLHTNGVFFPFVRQTIRQDYEGNSGYRASAVGYAYNAISNNLTGSTCNLTGQTNYGEVLSVNISAHTFTATNTTAPVYKQLTYATISGNTDIIDHVLVDNTSANSAGSVVLRQTSNSYYSVTGDLFTKNELICPGTFATTVFTYDSYGNVHTVTDPVGIVTTTDYDSTAATYPVRKYTGSLGANLIEYSLYDARSGALTAATNMAGLVTSNTYDFFFRITNSAISTSAGGAPTLTRLKYDYKLGGISSGGVSTNYVHVQKNDPADASSGFHETWSYFDGLGRPIQTRSESEIANVYRVSDFVYDDRGSLIIESYPTFGTNSGYGKLPNASRTNYVFTEYDPIGRAFRVNPCAKATFTSGGILSGNASAIAGDSGSPTGPSSIAFKDDGTNPWAIITTNSLGKIHKYILDAFGRTNQIVEVTSQGSFTSFLSYNQVGDLTNITDSASNQISFLYNLVGEKVAEADPDRGFWQFALDAAGRLKVQTDAKGQQIKLFYEDAAGRLTRREGWDAASQLSSVMTNLYDSSGGDSAYTVLPGQTFATFDDEGWTKNSYDVRGRVLKTVRYLSKNKQTYTNLFTYDDADRLSSTTYPNGGPTVTNNFDTGENLTQVKRVDTGGTNMIYYAAQAFDELDRVTGISFGNGAATTFGYYKVSRRLNQVATTISGSTTIQNFTNRYDAVGNVIALQDTVAAHTGSSSATISSASYDDLNRLTTAVWSGYGTQSYSFDSTGNIRTNTEFGAANYVYGPNRPHFVRSANGVWYTSDQNGNVVFRSGQRLDFDVNNRLYRVTNTNGVQTAFGYDANGHRLWESTSTNTLQVWIGDDYEERDGKTIFHIAAAGRRVCSFEPAAGGTTGYNASSQEFYFYHPDYLTSSSLLTERSGTQVQHYEYSAFGQSRYTQSSTAFHVSKRFTGQMLDETTGLYYYNFRYYDPQMGRFVQPDDIIPDFADPQSWNRYAYCLNNPLRFTDPDGHSQNNVVAVASSSAMPVQHAPVTAASSIFAPPNLSARTVVSFQSMPQPVYHSDETIGPAQANPATYDSLLTGAPHLMGTKVGRELAEQNAQAILSAPGSELIAGKIIGTFARSAATVAEESTAVGAKVPFSGRYADGQKAYRTSVPRDRYNNPIPDPAAEGSSHTRLQFDKKSPGRVYSGTEFDKDGKAIKRVDLAGRKGDPLPHSHSYNRATKEFGKEKIPLQKPSP